MRIKNIFKKAISLFSLVMFFNLSLTSLAYESVTALSVEHINECDGIRFFISVIVIMFLALVLWAISPVGILFFLSAKTLILKSSSMLNRKFAWVVRGIAFLTWTSVMFLLLILYIDAISCKIFNLGGDILNLAIISGVAFFVVMILVIFIEKTICCCGSSKKSNRRSNGGNNKSIPKRNKKPNDSVKFAGIEFGGIKQKVRRKLKEDLKEIIDDEIDRRL